MVNVADLGRKAPTTVAASVESTRVRRAARAK